MSFEFLSPAWIEAVRTLRDSVDLTSETVPLATSINVTITQGPPGTATAAHIDTTSGVPLIDEGHLGEVELTVTVDYETARNLFVAGNPAAVMGALLEGKIRIDGDASKLIALQSANVSPQAANIAQKIRAFTI